MSPEHASQLCRPDAKAPPRILFLLGMHRSGTSALARALNLVGCRMPGDLLGANQDNPMGHWESRRVVAFNDELLATLDRHWADPKPMPRDWLGDTRHVGFVNRAVALLDDLVGKHEVSRRPLIIKDPRLSRVAPLWIEAARKAGHSWACVIACRHPAAVAASLDQRDHISRDHALELWLSYMLEAEQTTRDGCRWRIDYDEFLDDPVGEVQRLTRGMQLPVHNAGAWQRLKAFVDPSLRHQRAGEAKADRPEIADWATSAYRLLTGQTSTGIALEFDAIGSAYLQYWARKSPGSASSGIQKNTPSWYAELAWKFIADNDFESAVQNAMAAIQRAPHIPRLHYILGVARRGADNIEDAVDAFRASVDLSGGERRFQRALLEMLSETETPEVRLEAAQLRCEINPSGLNFHRLGTLLRRHGRHRNAICAFMRATELEPQNADYHHSLAISLHHQWRNRRAVRSLRCAIQLGRGTATDWDLLGRIEASQGRWKRSQKSCNKALEIRRARFGMDKAEGGEVELARDRLEVARTLARLCSRAWTSDLIDRVQNQEHTGIKASEAIWPQGNRVPPRTPTRLDFQPFDNPAAPLLSIMIPVYEVGRERWLRHCLDSVISQDQGPQWAEIVVVDDASRTDLARQIAESYDGRVDYVRNDENLGLVGSHNRCLQLARGQYVHFLHQDDQVEQGFYSALLQPLQANSDLRAAFCHNIYVNPDGKPHGSGDVPRPRRGELQDWWIRLSLEIRIQFPTIIVRRSTYAQVGGFFPGRRFSFDWDMWNHVAASGPVWYEPRPLARFRVHEDSATYGFSMLERVVDAMQTVADMVQLVPQDQRLAVSEMGLYKFFERYWAMVLDAPDGRLNEQQGQLLEFLVAGIESETDIGTWLRDRAEVQWSRNPLGVERTLCLTLPEQTERQAAVSHELAGVGIGDPEFFHGIGPDAPEVFNTLKTGKVLRFPPCFRCGKLDCGRPDCNNVLLPAQIAVVIAFRRLFQHVLDQGYDTVAVCEDDIVFAGYAKDILESGRFYAVLARTGLYSKDPTLIRLGNSLRPSEFDSSEAPSSLSLERHVVMSNYLFICNRAFAEIAVERLESIDHTADVLIHKSLVDRADCYTLLPQLVCDRSWSLGTVASLIHPKSQHIEHLRETLGEQSGEFQAEQRRLLSHRKKVTIINTAILSPDLGLFDRLCDDADRLGIKLGVESIGRDGFIGWSLVNPAVAVRGAPETCKDPGFIHIVDTIIIADRVTEAVTDLADRIRAGDSHALQLESALAGTRAEPGSDFVERALACHMSWYAHATNLTGASWTRRERLQDQLKSVTDSESENASEALKRIEDELEASFGPLKHSLRSRA